MEYYKVGKTRERIGSSVSFPLETRPRRVSLAQEETKKKEEQEGWMSAWSATSAETAASSRPERAFAFSTVHSGARGLSSVPVGDFLPVTHSWHGTGAHQHTFHLNSELEPHGSLCGWSSLLLVPFQSRQARAPLGQVLARCLFKGKNSNSKKFPLAGRWSLEIFTPVPHHPVIPKPSSGQSMVSSRGFLHLPFLAHQDSATDTLQPSREGCDDALLVPDMRRSPSNGSTTARRIRSFIQPVPYTEALYHTLSLPRQSGRSC